MTKRTITVRLLGQAMSGWAVAVSAQPVSPYAGQQSHEIKGLSPKVEAKAPGSRPPL